MDSKLVSTNHQRQPNLYQVLLLALYFGFIEKPSSGSLKIQKERQSNVTH
jgi:hypothetical protein